MKKYTYLVNFDSQALERVGESFAVKGDGGIAELEFIIPSDFGIPPTQAVWRAYYKLPGERESLFETLPTVEQTESGDYVTGWVVTKALTQTSGRLGFSLAAISGNNIQWNSRTVIMQVQESQYQPESEEAEEPYTGRLAILEGDMAAIRSEFGDVVDEFEELKETATLGTPIPKSLASEMVEGGVYLYTGTEPGYTAGHVYYYVNGTLTDGGVYGGTEVDTTLTQSGQAADAAVVGGELSQIKEDLSDLSGVIAKTITGYHDITSSLTWSTGFVKQNGSVNSTNTSYTKSDLIDVQEGDVFYITPVTHTPYRYVTAYSNGSAVEASGAESVYSYVVPSGIDQIIISAYNNASFDSQKRIVIRIRPEKIYVKPEKPVSTFKVRKPMLTIIDDDGYMAFYTYMVPLMRTYHVPMVSAYEGDVDPSMSIGLPLMTKAQCQEIVALGGEIVVHGGTELTSFGRVADAEANVIKSKDALAGNGFYSDIYVYPGGANNVNVRDMISNHFKCAFKTGFPVPSGTRVNTGCVPHYFINRCSAGGYYDSPSSYYGNYATHTLDYFKALIDDAAARNGWLVLMTHAWMMPIGSSYRTGHDEENGIPADLDEFALLGNIIAYAQAQGVDIVTASEGFDTFSNAVQCGDYLGEWNEDIQDTSTYQHSKAGFAINRLGDFDFADSNRISHS